MDDEQAAQQYMERTQGMVTHLVSVVDRFSRTNRILLEGLTQCVERGDAATRQRAAAAINDACAAWEQTNDDGGQMYTITLSGPAEKRALAREALLAAGFTQAPEHFRHGLHGDAGTFVSVEGEDINLANSVVERFGWQLRKHEKVAGSAMPVTSLEAGGQG